MNRIYLNKTMFWMAFDLIHIASLLENRRAFRDELKRVQRNLRLKSAKPTTGGKCRTTCSKTTQGRTGEGDKQ